MQARLRDWCGWTCLVVGFSQGALLGAGDASVPAPTERFEAQIVRLGDRDYEVREQAVAALLQARAEAIDPLLVAAEEESIEVAARAVNVLEKLFLSEDAQLAGLADDALEKLAHSDNSRTALRADAVLSRYYELREQRAVAAIRSLGGKVQFVEDQQTVVMGPQFGWQGAPARGADDVPTLPLRLDKVILGTDWKGGTAGLKHLRRLRHRSGFQLYVIRGSQVPIEKAEGLSRVLRNLTVLDRGPFLGISGGQNPHCRVGELTAGASAKRAGIHVHDEIVSLNGRKIANFQALVEVLTDYHPGDTVTIGVKRGVPGLGLVELEFHVTLDPWEPYFSDSADLTPPDDETLREPSLQVR